MELKLQDSEFLDDTDILLRTGTDKFEPQRAYDMVFQDVAMLKQKAAVIFSFISGRFSASFPRRSVRGWQPLGGLPRSFHRTPQSPKCESSQKELVICIKMMGRSKHFSPFAIEMMKEDYDVAFFNPPLRVNDLIKISLHDETNDKVLPPPIVMSIGSITSLSVEMIGIKPS